MSSWSGRHRPSVGGSAHTEHGQACEVDRAGEEPEVGINAVGAANPGSSSAVTAAHQVREFAFNLRSVAR